MTRLPKRIATVHVEQLGDELCVYDWERHVVHSLNGLAARVWMQCDGRTSIEEAAATLDPDQTPDVRRALIALTLRELEAARLVTAPTTLDAPPMPRRELLKQAGRAALALPVITSIVAPTPLQAQSGASQTFLFTGGPQTFVVPSGSTRITVIAFGAAGGRTFESDASAGLGGGVTATLPATAGEVLVVTVGGVGPDHIPHAPTPAGGFNGGGGSAGDGAGGGGATDIRRGSNRILVAGGGAGGGNGGKGGVGGGLVGGTGTTIAAAGPGQGGTQTAGGAGGTAGLSGTAGTDGTSGTGGTGGTTSLLIGGGGGGGGYFGGGGGAGGHGPEFPSLGAAGGGGGSSYTDPAATGVVHTQGVRAGNGQVQIFWS